jgi:hypothetical protein
MSTSSLLGYWWGMDTQTQHHKTTQQFRQVMPYVSMCVCQVEMAQHVVALTMFVGLIVSTWVIWFRHSMLVVDPTTSNNRSKAMPQLGQLVNGCCQVVSVERHVLQCTICNPENTPRQEMQHSISNNLQHSHRCAHRLKRLYFPVWVLKIAGGLGRWTYGALHGPERIPPYHFTQSYTIYINLW